MPMNYYRAMLYQQPWWVLDRLYNGAPTIIGFWSVQTDLSTWYRWRLTFWNGATPDNIPALVVKLEREEAGEWVDYGNVYDTTPVWGDSAVNRLGLFIHGTWSWHDDTEIWVPT